MLEQEEDQEHEPIELDVEENNEHNEPIESGADETRDGLHDDNETNQSKAGYDEPQATQDNESCTICMDEWTVGGEHRVCCLNCGHLFGRKCIEQWIKEKGGQAKCPICNKSTRKSHIRDLWVKSIKAIDNNENIELLKQLDNERKIRRTDSAMIYNQRIRISMLVEDVEKLKRAVIDRDQTISRMKAAMDQSMKRRKFSDQYIGEEIETSVPDIIDIEQEDTNDSHFREIRGVFHAAKKFESSQNGGCRSLAISSSNAIIIVSQPGPTSSIFDDFGLRKYSLLDENIREFIPLHKKNITAIDLRKTGDLVITAGSDKRVRITSLHNNICIQSYVSTYEPVSVAWSASREQQFYVATGNRYAQLYDMRNTSEHLYQSSCRISETRPLSIAATMDPEGILVNDIRGSQFLNISQESDYNSLFIDRQIDHFKHHSLPFNGLMGTVDYDHNKKLALITSRRGNSSQNSTHHLVKLQKITNPETGDSIVNCDEGKIFQGGKPSDCLSQSKILTHPTLEDCVLVGAWDGDARGIKLWDSSDSSLFQTIRTDLFIRDMAMYTPQNSNQHLLYTLGEKNINIYRWDYA